MSGRLLLVGDAAGYVDALTGEGIAVGLASARAAFAAIAAGTPTAYEKAVAGRHPTLSLAHRGPAVDRQPPGHCALIVPAAQRVPRLMATAVNQLAR